MSYITLTELRAYIGANKPTDDALLTNAISEAQASIDTYCKRTFECAADTPRYFDYIEDTDGQILYLDYDLCQITSVTNGDATTIASTDYTTNPRNSTPWCEIKLKLNSDIAWTYDDTPEDAIAIVGRWAFSITPPNDIKHACLRLAAWYYRQRDTSNTAAEAPILTNSGAVIMPSKLPTDVTDILSKYVRYTP